MAIAAGHTCFAPFARLQLYTKKNKLQRGMRVHNLCPNFMSQSVVGLLDHATKDHV